MEKIIKKQTLKQTIVFLVISLLTCLPMLLPGITDKGARAAASGLWIDEVDLGTYSLIGTGLEADPYQIGSPEDLAYMSKQSAVNSSVLNDKYYVLTSNIDLSAHFFTPIGSADAISQIMDIHFNGYNVGTNTYYSISGLTINSSVGNTGLFGYLYFSTVKNLTLSADIVSGGSNTGAVAGFMSSCTLDNITVNGQLTGTNNNLGGLVGAVTGYNNIIMSCINNATVSSQSGSNTGGIFASAISGNLMLSNCVNNGNISGVTYVAGLGSGSSNTDAVLGLTNCTNNGNIISVSPNHNYFAGLVANIGISLENQMSFCKNTGMVYAPNSAYVAGLLSFGKCQITDSFNTGNITGDTLVAGLAACGIFDIAGSFNTGNIEARSLGSNAIAGGLVGKLTDYAVIEASYNKGNITLGNDGFSAGILGCFEAIDLDLIDPIIIIDTYNRGAANAAFVGASNYHIIIENGYSLAAALAADSANITHSHIYTTGSSSEIYNNLSVNSAAWGLWNTYNDGYPYLRSGLVSEISINLNGGTADGAYTAFYVTDLFDMVSLDFNDFLKTGQTFTGFSTIQNDIYLEAFISNAAATFTATQPIHTLYVQYSLTQYNVSVQIESMFADQAGLFEADGLTPSATLSLFSDKVLISTQIGTNDFAYWAVKIGANLFQISNNPTCELADIFNEQFLLDYPYDNTSYVFVAVFEQSWTIEIEIIAGDKTWGNLDIIIGSQTTPFNFNNTGFHVTKDINPTQINFVLTALPYYKISQFSITAIGDIYHDTTIDPFDFDEFTMNRGVNLQSDLKISISFTKQIYYLSFASVYEDFAPTETSLILSGNNLGFYINQTITGSSIIAQTENLIGSRFVGLKLQQANGLGYSPFLSMQTAGQPNSFLVDNDLLDTYLNSSGRIIIVAVYQKQYQLNVSVSNADGEYGSINVLIDNITKNDFNQKYYDLGTNIKINISPSSHCYVASILINGTPHMGNINMTLNETKTVTIILEKTRYYLDIYTIDFYDQKITSLQAENLFVVDPKQDVNGTYIGYDDNLYIINSQALEYSSNMKFIGWYFVKGGVLIEAPCDIDDNLNIILGKPDLDNLVWTESGKNYITVVAKIINIYVLDMNLSETQKHRGDYAIELWNGTSFEEADKLITEFNIGSTLRITAIANRHFAFVNFEDTYGNTIATDLVGGLTITFVLDRSQTISLYFDMVAFGIQISQDLNSANGALTVSTDTSYPENLKIGENLVISFAPDYNLQVHSFEINGKTLQQIQSDFGGQILGNSIIISVSGAFLDWLDENDGQLDITISTGITTMFLIILLGSLLVIVFLALFVTIKIINNNNKKKLLTSENIRKAKIKHGLEFEGKLQALKNEAHGSPEVQDDIKKD
ncbi:MAG: hypothetical protein LBN07_04455 [Christensenellaceae bacterium]|nr:hypothetical protein [Christensenellaceae bacterium]